MKKSDLKKLAVLGLTGGILMTSQATADLANFGNNGSFGTYLAGGGCGGAGSCGGSGAPKAQNGVEKKAPADSVQKPGNDTKVEAPEENPKLFSGTNRFSRKLIIAENDEKPVEKKDDKDIKDIKDAKDQDSNKKIAVGGTNNGQKYPTMNHGEGELAESRIVSQLTKENLEKYRKMSFEGKQLTRKIAKESGDPNKAVSLAEKQLEDKSAKAKK